MLEYFAITAVAFSASFISFFSGFGLGTILMPIIAIFFPLPIAISVTAVIHLLHNLLKTGLLWKEIDWTIAIKFGLPALIASIPGALLLKELSEYPPLKEYVFWGIKGEISVLPICIGFLLILFASMEAFPLKKYRVNNLFLGGAVSGFFGGLSGNQGALRSVFLMHADIDKKVFIGTNAIIAAIVDIGRLVVYSLSFHQLITSSNLSLLGVTTVAAMGGVFVGMATLEKINLRFIQTLIITLLYILGVLLLLGVI